MKYRIPKTGKDVLCAEIRDFGVVLVSQNLLVVVFQESDDIIYINTLRLLDYPVRRGIYQFMNAIFDTTSYCDVKNSLEYGKLVKISKFELTYSKMIARMQKRLEILQ